MQATLDFMLRSIHVMDVCLVLSHKPLILYKIKILARMLQNITKNFQRNIFLAISVLIFFNLMGRMISKCCNVDLFPRFSAKVMSFLSVCLYYLCQSFSVIYSSPAATICIVQILYFVGENYCRIHG